MSALEDWYTKHSSLLGLVSLFVTFLGIILAVVIALYPDELKKRFRDVPREKRTAKKILKLRYRRLLITAFEAKYPLAIAILMERSLLAISKLTIFYALVRSAATGLELVSDHRPFTLHSFLDAYSSALRMTMDWCFTYCVVMIGSGLKLARQLITPEHSIEGIDKELAALGFTADPSPDANTPPNQLEAGSPS